MLERDILGLTKTEYKIFNDILRYKDISAGLLIKHLGLHKGTVYNCIRRLEEKGIISYKIVNNIRVYSINPFFIKNKMNIENNMHKERINKLKDIEKIMNLNIRKKEGADVKILTGIKGFKTFFNNLYEWAYKTKKEYLFIGKGNEMIEYFGEGYYNLTQIKKKKLGIKCKVILNKTSRKLPVKKYIVGDVKYLKMEYKTPDSIWIYNSNVVVVLWGSEPLLTIIINSKSLSNAYKNYFNRLCKISKY